MGSLIGIDIGGTFTDIAAFDPATGALSFEKTSTTPAPDDGARAGLSKLARTGFDVAGAELLKHGTTVVINSILQRRGAKTALVTTDGFRDILEIGRGGRPEPFNLFYKRLPPLAPRDLRFEIVERMSAKGNVVTPLDRAALPALAKKLRDLGVEAVGVCFLHAYRNPAHEREVADYLRANTSCFVSASHELSREFREFERSSTTVVNAFVGPLAGAYISRFEAGTRSAGFAGQVLLMGSNGGVLTTGDAALQPVQLIESGPVGGAIGAAEIGRSIGNANVIAFDMGGTTAKALMIEDGEAAFTSVYYAAGYARGYAIQAPVLDVVEVGTGGGSIAWINEIGALAVGPRSAGAVPGPACYGGGGVEPTVTDANLVLGRLHPDRFLGGEMKLDVAKARAAIGTLATRLGMTIEQVATGIIEIAALSMSTAIRMATVERGHDPRDFAMIAYGGAGPLHAVPAARGLGIRQVIIPNNPGHFSALGMLYANLRYEQMQTLVQELTAFDKDRTEQVLRDLEGQGRASLVGAQVTIGEVHAARSADLRYVNQEHTIRIELPADMSDLNMAQLRERFEAAYSRRYGRANPGMPVEAVNLRVIVDGVAQRPSSQRLAKVSGEPAQEFRDVMFTPDGFVSARVLQRSSLKAGFAVDGPAVIEETASTTIIFPGDQAEVDANGNILIKVGGQS